MKPQDVKVGDRVKILNKRNLKDTVVEITPHNGGFVIQTVKYRIHTSRGTDL